MESLDDAFNVLNILGKDFIQEDKERAKLAREKLASIGETHEFPIIRYAANRIINPETRTNSYCSFKIWLHESAAEDIAAIGICSIFAGFIGLVGNYGYRILNN